MSISQNFPPSRPRLNLNFARTKELDPRVTFSRSSSGTYVDRTGIIRTTGINSPRFDHDPVTGVCNGLLIEESRTNLVTYSEQFDNAYWSKNFVSVSANIAISPDGTTTADKLVEKSENANHSLQSTAISVSTSTRYTYSIFAKAGERTKFQLVLGQSTAWGTPCSVSFDLSKGSIISINSDTANVTANIINLSNGWYRCTMSANRNATVASGFVYVFLLDASGSLTYVGDGTSGIYIWGAQLEQGSFPTSYIPTPATFTSRTTTATFYDINGTIQTAAVNTARSAAYFPDTNKIMRSAGLLLENAATNTFFPSNDFTTGNWVVDGANLTTLAITAPDGTNTGTGITLGTGNNQVYQFDNAGAGTTGNKAFSVFVRAGTGTSLNITTVGQVAPAGTANVSVSSGTSAIITGTGFTFAYSQAFPNGWYRVVLPINVSVASGNSTYISLSNPSSSPVYIWGAQLETGTYATSYIPTTVGTGASTRAADNSTSSTVTRAADVATISGTNFTNLYNTSGGTITATVTPNRALDRTNVLTIGDGTNTNYALAMDVLPGAGGGQIRSTSSTIPQTDLTSVGSGQTAINIAASFTNNSFAINSNSNRLSTGSTGTLATPNQMQIGVLGSTNRLNGAIGRISYYPVVVSNSNITTLSDSVPQRAVQSNQFAFTVRIPSASYTYTLLTNNSGTYNYNVDWGDGSVTNGITTNNPTRTYVNPGVYRIVVTQNSGSFRFNNNNNTTLGPVVTSVTSVGTGFSWSSSLANAWYGCSSLTSFPFINTSNVTSFQTTWLFASLTSFPLIDTSNVTDFSSAWQQCFYLNSFPLLNTSNGTNFNSSWFACSSLTSFPQIDTSKGTNFKRTWYACSSLTSFPLINTSNGTDFSGTWQNCSSLTSFPLIDTSKGTNFANTWVNCTSLTSFPLINTSNGTNFNGTWYNCYSLTSFPTLNVSSGNDFTNAWRQTPLTSFPAITFGGAGNTNPTFTSTWQSCTILSSFPTGAFNACTGSTNYTQAFTSCGLGTTSIENILTSIVSSGATINTPVPGNIGLSGGTNASFSTWTSPAITAYNTLVGAGWTISYNP